MSINILYSICFFTKICLALRSITMTQKCVHSCLPDLFFLVPMKEKPFWCLLSISRHSRHKFYHSHSRSYFQKKYKVPDI